MAYSQEERKVVQDFVCLRMALGQSLSEILRDFKVVPDTRVSIPDYATIIRWRNEDADFCANYARAREDQADYHADEVVTIADTERDPNVARVRIDARKWKASKMNPKTYGDRLNIEQDITLKVSPEQRRARIEHLLQKNAELIGTLGNRANGTPGLVGAGGSGEEAHQVLRDVPGDGSPQT